MNLPMKIERTVSSETSAIRTQKPGNYPKRNTLHLEHGERLKTRTERDSLFNLNYVLQTDTLIIGRRYFIFF